MTGDEFLRSRLMRFPMVRPEKLAGPAVILIAAAVATSPLKIFNFSCGHDFDFHLVSWFDALHAWSQGVVYPHWASSPNYGAGEPRFIFYPPLTWMLGAALGRVFPWVYVPIVLTFLLLSAMGFATRALAREALNERPATLAGCTVIFSAYALFTVYERSAYAELCGGFWMPLLLLFILREGRPTAPEAPKRTNFERCFGGAAVPLAMVVAGAWLSNAPVGVMACYLLAACALAVAFLLRSWIPVVRAAAGVVLGLGLAAFYLVPAAWEQRWVDIRQATDDPGLLVQNSFIFGRHSSPLLEQHDIELFKVSCIAVAMTGLALAGLVVSWKRRGLPGRRFWWIPLALIPVVVFILQTPITLPVWNALPKLQFLQFPWRWLVVQEAPMAIFATTAVWVSSGWRRIVVLGAVGTFFVGSAAFAGRAFFQACDSEDAIWPMVMTYRAGTGFEGTDEYAPTTADNSLMATDLPPACLLSDPQGVLGVGDPDLTPQWSPDQGSCEATFPFQAIPGSDEVRHRSVLAKTPRAGFLVLRLREYPAWTVRVNGAEVERRPIRRDGLIVVPVPEGRVKVTVDWTTTRDVIAGRWVSAIALAIVTAVSLLMRKRAQPRLK